MKTINEFVKGNRLTIKVERVDNNPNMARDKWSRQANHYKTILRRQGKQMTVYFSMGSALINEPTVEDVVNCIGLDSVTYLNNDSFEDFCSEYGYTSNQYEDEGAYKQAKQTYNAVMKQGKKAEILLGLDLLNELAYEVEKL